MLLVLADSLFRGLSDDRETPPAKEDCQLSPLPKTNKKLLTNDTTATTITIIQYLISLAALQHQLD